MRRCAFLSMVDLTGFVSYDALVREPLLARGWMLDEVPWRNADITWADYDVVVIRTTWDYQQHPDAFLAVLERIANVTTLENPIGMVRWNLRKTYLRDLDRSGVRTVRTLWGDDVDVVTLRAAFDTLDTDEIIIKPQVGANAGDTFRLHRRASGGARARTTAGAHTPADVRTHAGTHTHVGAQAADAHSAARDIEQAACTFAQRPHMVQPFIASVVEEGEFSLIFIDGSYSHTILKTPRRGDFRVQEEHGGVIRAIEPDSALLKAAQAAVAAIDSCVPRAAVASARAAPSGSTVPLYARADFVRMEDGGFALMELELIEPSLYLSYDPAAATRLADAITRR
jgi:hypothetical protein